MPSPASTIVYLYYDFTVQHTTPEYTVEQIGRRAQNRQKRQGKIEGRERERGRG